MRQTSYLLLLFCLLAGYGCTNKHSSGCEEQPSKKFIPGRSTNFKTDIPEFQRDYFQRILRSKENKIGIEPLDRGYQGWQLRLWIHYEGRNTNQVIIFKQQDSCWIGKFVSFIYEEGEFGEALSLKKKISRISPKSGWDVFIRNLQNTGIESLRDYGSLDKYNVGSYGDHNYVTVELATDKLYRIFEYVEPRNNLSVDQIVLLNKALELIKEEFGLNFDQLYAK